MEIDDAAMIGLGIFLAGIVIQNSRTIAKLTAQVDGLCQRITDLHDRVNAGK